MKSLLILGAGTAGTMAANKLSRWLNSGWTITLVDPEPLHLYQPGYLFIPFGVYTRDDVVKPKSTLLPSGVKLVQARVTALDPIARTARLDDRQTLRYDFLIVATGADIDPGQTPGLAEHAWGHSVHTFYSLEGSLALAEKLRTWEGGRLVVNVVENPIKCPVAPLEFLMLADAFLRERHLRHRVELVYATPLPGAFTKPKAAAKLGRLLEEKRIHVEPEFMIERVDPDKRTIVSYDEREITFDLLVSVPLNTGAAFVGASGLGDELNFARVDPRTLRSTQYPNVFALGDAANVPASKAGSVAHFEVDGFVDNFLHYINGGELKPLFDGHANCFVETGDGKGLLIDFNYDTEPLPGRYPLPAVGPFTLLEESRMNHWGKLAFRWIYWNVLLNGLPMPLPAQMSMVGKDKS
jgi:sulfide:quinone oxidoreductase